MQNNESLLVDNIKRLFQRKRIIKIGDTGIYRDVLSVDTVNDSTHGLKYEIYAKVRALAIYEDLVEIEVLDLISLNSSNKDIKGLVETNMPKYLKPRFVKWEVK